MNRTDRLYALVEELRAVAPRTRSARWLAQRFEVSARTVERDIGALQQAGVPIYAAPGRTGGYTLDKATTLPPVNLSAGEAVAMAVGLHGLAGTPFHAAARSALRKLVAVMPEPAAAVARELAGRVHLVGEGPVAPVPAVVADALLVRRVLLIEYADRAGALTVRRIEPLGYVGNRDHWYLIGWCRLRRAVRAFRTDRIASVYTTEESAPARPLHAAEIAIPHRRVSQLTLD
ncbi:YafY family protein [Actinoplanes sp. NPDC051346]|uniref:helix-turn-helix transcriptional regulator n=1 Tax=Actinoplanes sp. NPDC051346 TaxID=3155048 RepID=UPI003425D15E